MLLLSSLLNGLAIGSMYGLLGLGFHVTWSVSRTVNFAQGSGMMLGAVLCYSLWITWAWPLWAAIPATLALTALYGLVIERAVVRPFRSRGSDAWLMATVAAGLLVDNLAMAAFGREPRGMPSSLTQSFPIFDVGVQPLQLLIIAVGLGAALLFHFVTRRSLLGKALLAVVQNPRAASLMGIPVDRVIAASYALSALMAGVAGILIAPLYTVSSTIGFLFGIKAFAVAILGGLDNAWGVFCAGLLFGAAESLVTALFGSSFTGVLTFGFVIAALVLRPHGLFGQAGVVKV